MKRNKHKEPFVKLTFSMIDSLAFLSLDAGAQALYIHIARRYNGYNNGRISFSNREAGKCIHASPTTAGKYLNALVDKGFLRIIKDSAFNYKQRKAREYELTQWQLERGTAPNNDWRFWGLEKITVKLQ